MAETIKTKVLIIGRLRAADQGAAGASRDAVDGVRAMRVWLTCLFGIAAMASAEPAAACRDFIGRPPPPIRTLEAQDADYLRQGAVVAVASVTARSDNEWTFRVDGPATGDFADEVTLETVVLVDCRTEPMPIVPEEGALGDRVLLVRSDANNIQYAVMLETQRGRRLWTRASRSGEVQQ